MHEVANKTAYKYQKLWFMRTIKATVKSVFVDGQKVQSAICTRSTKPIFRSESARYVLFVQMSKEMWDFDNGSSGEIIFGKVVNSFLPELFKRWQRINARHLVTVVLFTRMQYQSIACADSSHASHVDKMAEIQADGAHYSDFYRVVVSDMASGEWSYILSRMKTELRTFLRDVSIRHPCSSTRLPLDDGFVGASDRCPDWVISGQPSIAAQGNILEAINLASLQFSDDHIDRDLVRTGVSVAIVSPGTGIFEVDYQLLVTTTENLVANEIGVDLICLSRVPLHSVPLFKYTAPPAAIGRQSAQGLQSDVPANRGLASPKPVVSLVSQPGIAFSLENKSACEGGLSTRIKQEAWCYVIPHWIDVSFWTCPSENDSFPPGWPGKSMGRAAKFPLNRQGKIFLPRVRMHKLQMFGVMEDAIDDISIPYLEPMRRVQKASRPLSEKKPAVTRESTPIDLGAGEPQNSSLGSSLWFSPSLRGSVTPTSGQLVQHMVDYDEEIFLDLNKSSKPASSQSNRAKRRSSNWQTPRVEDWSYKPSTSRGGYRSSLEEQHPVLRAIDHPNNTVFIDEVEAREAGAYKKAARNEVKTRLNRFPRQISLGPRGFGIATPKAIASTELTAEYAKPESSLGQTSQMQMPQSTWNRSTLPRTSLKPTSSSVSTWSGESASDRWEHSQSSDSEAQSSSRPIPIRKLTAFRIQGNSGGPHNGKEHLSFKVAHRRGKSLHAGSKNEEQSTVPCSTLRTEIEIDGSTHARIVTAGYDMQPWLTVLNPSNPNADGYLSNCLGRWQHILPRPSRTSKIKWKSLCSPATVPITTECCPTPEQLSKAYRQCSYSVDLPKEADLAEQPRPSNWLLREMISLRLSHGYQIVIHVPQSEQEGLDIFDKNLTVHDSTVLELTKGASFHRLRYIEGKAVAVDCFVRHPATSLSSSASSSEEFAYRPSIRTMLAETYALRDMKIHSTREEFEWREIDAFLTLHAGKQPSELPKGLQYWRARFVLIPVDPPTSHRRPLQPVNEDNEEEVRLEGICKLTQVWQRFRYVPIDERRFQASSRKRNDTNPLDIIYHTRNPSAIVAAEKGDMAESATAGKPIELLPESELLQRSNLSLSLLAQIIQSEKGVRMMDRRWHWRLHYNCFIGFELTSWLLQNFRDIDSRDEAVEFGNELMSSGLFQHVEQRHNFRDGNFFYQIAGDHRTPRAEARTWFGSRKSVPPTPASEDVVQVPPGSRASSHPGEQSEDDAATPSGDKQPLAVVLSKSMLYDVDHRRRSHRPELISLHYDRLHNPDNCYHFRIDWVNVTSKLIDDAILSWAATVERFGLRLVEVPIAEACAITEKNPFRAPYSVTLVRLPPDKQPEYLAYLDARNFSTHNRVEPYFYEKSLLKKLDYVLDLEAAEDFPPDVDVRGKPDFRYPQYIHRSGVLLAQITGHGSFALLANRLYDHRPTAGQEAPITQDSEPYRRKAHGFRNTSYQRSPRTSPYSSPLIRPKPDLPLFSQPVKMPTYVTAEQLKSVFEEFCHNETALDAFYDDTLNKAPIPGRRTPYLESAIPSIGLPPNLSLQEGSPASGGNG